MSWLAWVGLITGVLALLTTLARTRGPVYVVRSQAAFEPPTRAADPVLEGHDVLAVKNGCGSIVAVQWGVSWENPDIEPIEWSA